MARVTEGGKDLAFLRLSQGTTEKSVVHETSVPAWVRGDATHETPEKDVVHETSVPTSVRSNANDETPEKNCFLMDDSLRMTMSQERLQ